MNVWTAIEVSIYASLAVLFVLGLYWAWYTSFKSRRRTSRGISPGQGGIVITAESGGGMHGGGLSGATIIPKDPQLYAQGMVPGHARKTK